MTLLYNDEVHLSLQRIALERPSASAVELVMFSTILCFTFTFVFVFASVFASVFEYLYLYLSAMELSSSCVTPSSGSDPAFCLVENHYSDDGGAVYYYF